MAKIGDLFVRLGLKKEGFDRGIKDASNATKSFGNSATKFLGGVAAKFLSVAAAIKVLGDSVKTMATFQRANSTLASVLRTTTAGIKELTQSAKELGRQTEFTASDVTHLQTELARLGFQQEDILNMQKSVLKFASAVNTDLASAAAFAGGSLRAFGLNTEDTKDLLDIMADATAKSALSFGKLETAMGIVFPTAKTFGLSVADTVAMLGALSNVMPDVSSAATAMRNILLNLADDHGKLATAIGHSAKTFPEIVAALEELNRKGVDLNEILGMTDKRSANAMASFISNTRALKDLRAAFEDSTGAVDEMYDTMTNNLLGSVKQLKSAWEGFVLSLENSTGPMKTVVDWMTKMVNKITDFNNAAETGGKSSSDKKQEQGFLDFYKGLADKYSPEFARDYYQKQLKAAEKAYNEAMDAWVAHKTRRNKKARDEAGKAFYALQEIGGQVNAYRNGGPHENNALKGSAPTGSGVHQLTDEEKDEQKREKKRIEAIKVSAMQEKEALVAKYEENLKLFRKYNQDTTALTEQFSRDLVAALKIEAVPDDLAEKVMDDPARLEKHYNELLAIADKYGIDSKALTDKYNNLQIEAWKDIDEADAEAVAEAQELGRKWLEAFAMANNIDLTPAMTELRQLTDETIAAVEQQEAAMERWAYLVSEFADSVSIGFSDACQEMMDQLFGLQEVNAGAIFKALLEPLADLAIKQGEILIAEGIGVEACKSALESLNGYAAIAAGAALVAIGAAAKSGLQALASSGSRNTSTGVAYSGSAGSAGAQTIETELTVNVKGTIRGSDIVLSGQKTVNSWGR
jgi:TP901 family phage tail tape measure protein